MEAATGREFPWACWPTKVHEDAVAHALFGCCAETRLGVGRTSTRVSMQHARVRALLTIRIFACSDDFSSRTPQLVDLVECGSRRRQDGYQQGTCIGTDVVAMGMRHFPD